MFTNKQPILMFCFEGIDGAGKTSLITAVMKLLNEALTGPMGPVMRVISAKLPAEDVPLGTELRAAIKAGTLTTRQEVLGLAMNRAQVADCLRQQIAECGHQRNTIVLMDRWCGSSEAYQGTDDPLIAMEIPDIHKRFVGLYPTATFYVDIDPVVARERMTAARPSLDPNEVDIYRQGHIRQTYLHLAKQHQWVVLNGEYPVDRLAHIVVENIYDVLSKFKKENDHE